MTDFEAAHLYFAHALAAAPEKISMAFVDVRNSSVRDIKQIQALNAQKSCDNFKEAKNKLIQTRKNLQDISSSSEALISLRGSIQALLTQAPSQALDAHADLFQDSDLSDSDKAEWENIGSDEEIIT